MPRRDQLTYDVDVRERRDIPWPSVLLLIVVLFLAVVLVTWVVSSTKTRTSSAPSDSTSVVAPASTPSAPTISSGPTGSDMDEGLPAPEGSQRTVTQFVAAWLDRDPASRKASLGRVASPALAEQLMLTDPTNIPVARVKGPPTLEDASTYSAQFTQLLTTGMSIRVYLVADPQAHYRWLATSVEQV